MSVIPKLKTYKMKVGLHGTPANMFLPLVFKVFEIGVGRLLDCVFT